MFDPLPSPP
uniref:Uncharacterized protein n=1 Tax=Moniliophthora roreri TaxID=221103 RepID=A0A0W0FTY0_MONRR